MKKRYVQNPITLKLEERDPTPRYQSGVMIAPDLPDFVSPVDRKLWSGRRGLREHCQRHDVVPTADLAGLPTKRLHTEQKPDRAAIREAVQRAMYQYGAG